MLPFFIAAAIEPESLSSPPGSAKRFAVRATNRPLSLPRQGVNVRRKHPLTNGRKRTLPANGGTPLTPFQQRELRLHAPVPRNIGCPFGAGEGYPDCSYW